MGEEGTCALCALPVSCPEFRVNKVFMSVQLLRKQLMIIIIFILSMITIGQDFDFDCENLMITNFLLAFAK